MNELNKKIESMLEHSLPIMPDNQVWLLTNDLSKLFLEEIKEAFEAGKQFGSDIQWLKSKYNIDHQER